MNSTPNATHAINLLETLLHDIGPARIAYWVTPNVILTLAGARAFADGVFWVESDVREQCLEDIKAGLHSLDKTGNVHWSRAAVEKLPDGGQYVGFDMLWQPGLAQLAAQTNLIQANYETLAGLPDEEAVIEYLMKLLRERAECKRLNKENLQHLAFGLLVGYPDEAITAAVKAWQSDDKLAAPMVSANIRGAGYYTCPQPVYQYPHEVLGNAAVVAHEQTWSAILSDYYTSPFHQALEQDKTFQRTARILGLL